MRLLIPLFLLLPLGCATARSTTRDAPEAPVETTTTSIDFSALFGGSAARSHYLDLPDDPSWLARLLVSNEFLDPHSDDAPTEHWTLEMLQSGLAERGTTLHAPVAPPPPPETAPTAELRAATFASGTDRFPVLVRQDEGDVLRVTIRSSDKQTSLCGPKLDVELGFVILRGTLLRRSDGFVAAVFNQFTLADAIEPTRVPVDLPTSRDSPLFCERLQVVFDEHRALRVTDSMFVQAATRTLKVGLEPLYRLSP